MIRVAICHERELIRTLLRTYCADYFCVRGILFELKEYTSGESMLLEDFPDILFLGIWTGQIDGILIKEILQKLRAQTRILFVAEAEPRIFEAFGKNVFGFLQEPVEFTRFKKKLTEMVWDYFEQKNVIYCKQGKRIEKVSLVEVLYVESYGRYTKLYVRGRSEYLLCEKCLGDWIIEKEYEGFLWCHRRFLVNILHIRQIGTKWIELENEVYIPFSRRHREECRMAYQHFIGRIQKYEERHGTVYCNFKAEL